MFAISVKLSNSDRDHERDTRWPLFISLPDMGQTEERPQQAKAACWDPGAPVPSEPQRCRYRSRVVRVVSTLPPLLPTSWTSGGNLRPFFAKPVPCFQGKLANLLHNRFVDCDDRESVALPAGRWKCYKLAPVFVLDHRNAKNDNRTYADISIGEGRAGLRRGSDLHDGEGNILYVERNCPIMKHISFRFLPG